MAKGWINPEYGKWYYMLEDGTMVTGWLRIGDDYYLCAATAAWEPAGVRWTEPGIISRKTASVL